MLLRFHAKMYETANFPFSPRAQTLLFMLASAEGLKGFSIVKFSADSESGSLTKIGRVPESQFQIEVVKVGSKNTAQPC